MRYFFTLLLLITLSLPLSGTLPYFLQIGPEIYHMNRLRDGGTQQSGMMDGIRVTAERKKFCSWYLGADYFYATGTLKGETGFGIPLHSQITDHIYEIRFGYNLYRKECEEAFFIPFGGWGKFKETNDFFRPSPLPCTFTDHFSYYTIGFLSGMKFNQLFGMGLNFKAKFMQNGQSEVSGDPNREDFTLIMQDELFLRVEVPFTLTPCNTWLDMFFTLSPFYEFRHFGGRDAFPFSFKDTKFHLYGANLSLTYHF